MAKYKVWWQDVGEVYLGVFEAKSHKEVRQMAMKEIVIRKVRK